MDRAPLVLLAQELREHLRELAHALVDRPRQVPKASFGRVGIENADLLAQRFKYPGECCLGADTVPIRALMPGEQDPLRPKEGLDRMVLFRIRRWMKALSHP